MRKMKLFMIAGLVLTLTCSNVVFAEENQEITVVEESNTAEVLNAESQDGFADDGSENLEDEFDLEDGEEFEDEFTEDEGEDYDEEFDFEEEDEEVEEILDEDDTTEVTINNEEKGEKETTEVVLSDNKKSPTNKKPTVTTTKTKGATTKKPTTTAYKKAPFQTGVVEFDNVFIIGGCCLLGLGGLFFCLKKFAR